MAHRRQKLCFEDNESCGWIPGLGDNKPRPRKFFEAYLIKSIYYCIDVANIKKVRLKVAKYYVRHP